MLISSPSYSAYDNTDIWLNFTQDEAMSWIKYSLDGMSNQTISGNTLLQSLSEGFHSIFVYANNTGGYVGFCDLVYFFIDLV